MDPFSLTLWLYFAMLVALNLLDWFTTMILLIHFKGKKPIKCPMPLWKGTRFGKWLRRRRWWKDHIKPPVIDWCHWYDHELNPPFKYGLKYLGVHVLTVGKLLPFIAITYNLTQVIDYLSPRMWFLMMATFLGMICLYMYVVCHNSVVLLKCLNAPPAKDG